MRRIASALLLACELVGLAACGQPSLTLEFDVPEPYRRELASVAVKILEPPALKSFDCADLAFGEIDPMTTTFAQVGGAQSNDLRTPLANIDRAARKLFWVDGLNERAERLVTGCAEVDAIDDDVEVAIAAEPVAFVTPPSTSTLSARLGEALPSPVALSVHDALGQPIGSVSARWRMAGGAGASTGSQVAADGTGRLSFVPDLPNRPGPVLLEVRVRWASGAPVVLSGLIVPPRQVIGLGVRARGFVGGAVGPNREKGFAALAADALGSSRVMVAYRNGASGALDHALSPQLFGTQALGVVDFGGRARDRVIAVGRDWNEVDPDGRLTPVPAFEAPVGVGAPSAVFTAGSCTGDVPPKVLISFGDAFALYTLDGLESCAGGRCEEYALSSGETVAAAGCVTASGTSPDPVRAILFAFGNSIGVYVGVPGVDATMPDFPLDFWLALGSGITFGRPGADGKRLLFGTQLSVNDIVVSRATLTGSGSSSVKLKVEGSDLVPEVPEVTAAGDLDGDGHIDVVSLYRRITASGSRWAAWIVLGAEEGGHRISGAFDLESTDLESPTLLVFDIDGDGLDDVVIAEQAGLPGSTASSSRLEIYPMGVPR